MCVNEADQYIDGSTMEEAKLAFGNFFAALDNAGFTTEDVVFVDIGYANLDDLLIVNKLFMEQFEESRRLVRSINDVSRLLFGGKVKVAVTAMKDL